MSIEMEILEAVRFAHLYGRRGVPCEYHQDLKDFTFHERYGRRMTPKERTLSRVLERNKRVNLEQLLVAYDNFYK